MADEPIDDGSVTSADMEPPETDKQKVVDTMALAIATAESHVEHTMKKVGKLPQDFFTFRKGADLHVKEGAKVLDSIGAAMAALGAAAHHLYDAHEDLERIRAYPDFNLPPPTRAKPGQVRPLGNGGGKNGWPQRKTEGDGG